MFDIINYIAYSLYFFINMFIKLMDNKTDKLNNIMAIGENLYIMFTDMNRTKTNIEINMPKI